MWSNVDLTESCAKGNLESALLAIRNGATRWNWGLYAACCNGHKELVMLMIEKGANGWNGGFANACYGGYNDIVMLMIEKGANEWSWGIEKAIDRGYKELVLLIIIEAHKSGDNFIDHVMLTYDDIYFLIQKGLNSFGKYGEVADYWLRWKSVLVMILDNYLCKDLIFLIMDF